MAHGSLFPNLKPHVSIIEKSKVLRAEWDPTKHIFLKVLKWKDGISPGLTRPLFVEKFYIHSIRDFAWAMSIILMLL
jgi:hypothetical protein